MGGFEERLFLDMVDYQLMDELKKNGKNRILVVPGTISQKLSGLDFSDKEASMRRFRIYYKDFKEYCRLTKKPLFYRIIIPLKRRINIGIHK
jgi:GT2 family glycosyltransferase